LQMVKEKIDLVLGMDYNDIRQETWDSLVEDVSK